MMKTTFLMLFIANFFYGQKCELDHCFKFGTDSVELIVKNNKCKKVKVPKKISTVFFQLIELEKFDTITKSFINKKKALKDINCIKCNQESTNLKKGKSIVYSITKNDLWKFNNVIEKGIYRARIHIDVIEFPIGCGSFESERIDFEIK